MVGLILVIGWVYYIGVCFKFWIDKILFFLISIVYLSIDIGVGVGLMVNYGCIVVECLLVIFWFFKYKREK